MATATESNRIWKRNRGLRATRMMPAGCGVGGKVPGRALWRGQRSAVGQP